MHKVQREVYLELASEMDSILCCFCKYSKSECGGSPCDCGESYCVHPLSDRLEEQYGGYGIDLNDDCWGFRPCHPVEFCADITGFCLSNNWESATWWQNKKGQWKVAEVKY